MPSLRHTLPRSFSLVRRVRALFALFGPPTLETPTLAIPTPAVPTLAIPDLPIPGPAIPTRVVATLTLPLLAVLAFTAPVGAQVLRGTLVDDATGQGIPGAEIHLLETDSSRIGGVLTDSLGTFVVPVPGLGEYMLRARRIGYGSRVSQRFPVTTLDTVDVQFHVAADAILLAPLMVRVRAVSGEELFGARVGLGKGVLFSPEMVDSLRPSTHPGEILRHADKVRVRWSWGEHEDGGNGPVPGVRTYLGGGCVNYIVDRTPVPDPFFERVSQWGVAPLSDLTPDDLVAVEVYRHVTEMPDDIFRQIEAKNAHERRKLRQIQRSTCGVVVFWTRDGW